MTNYEDFWTWVDQQLESRGLNYANLEKAAGLSNAAISKHARTWSRPPVGVCVAVTRVFGVSADYVLWMAGYIPKPPAMPAVKEEREVVAMFRSLPVHLRTVAVAVLRTLAAQNRMPEPTAPDDDLYLSQIIEEARRVPPEKRPEVMRFVVRLQKRYSAGEQSQSRDSIDEAAPQTTGETSR